MHPHLLIREMPNKGATSYPPKQGSFSDVSASFSEYVSQRGSETLCLILTHLGGSLYLYCHLSNVRFTTLQAVILETPYSALSVTTLRVPTLGTEGPAAGTFERGHIF